MAGRGGDIVGHLQPGMALPALALPSTLGGAVDLSRLEGRAVVYVYPWTGRPGIANPPGWDDIPGAHGSTPEAEGFRDAHREFVARGVAIYGVSGQDSTWQGELSRRLGLPFALLSDEAGELRMALSLPTFRAGPDTYLKRLTLITEAGRIAKVIHPVENPAGHAGEVLTLLEPWPERRRGPVEGERREG